MLWKAEHLYIVRYWCAGKQGGVIIVHWDNPSLPPVLTRDQEKEEEARGGPEQITQRPRCQEFRESNIPASAPVRDL